MPNDVPPEVSLDSAPKRVYLETFGCQMNVLDSQLVTSQLRALGYRLTDQRDQADVILYNTCSVRERAEQKVFSRIGEVGLLKRQRPGIVLGVLGCMAERDGKDMIRRHPQIDLLCGPGELDKVPLLIDNAVKTQPQRMEGRSGLALAQVALQGNTHRRSGTLSAAEDQLEMLDLARSFSPDEHQGSAYVRITRGCNKFCTYCVVPSTRGAEIHRPPQNILQECRKLVESGVMEITLLGQTVNHYHFEPASAVELHGVVQPQVGRIVNLKKKAIEKTSDGDVNFAQLLAMIHDEIPSLARLRFVTSFPRDFGDDILQVMADRPGICRYLHLPVQSGSDRMLQAMNRGYTLAEYLDLLDRVRRYLPDATLASDIICGFPGETDEDHQATIDLLRRSRFKNAFIFKYSPRPGTVAFDRLADDVPEEIKKQRNNELLAVQAQISAQVHREYVGQSVRVFVQSASEHQSPQADDAPGNPISPHDDVSSRRLANGALPSSGQNIQLNWHPAEASAKPSEIQLTGRTDGDLIVIFDGSADLIGKIVSVRIERSAPLALFGRLASG